MARSASGGWWLLRGSHWRSKSVSLPGSNSSDPGSPTQQNSASNNAVQKTAAPTATAQPTAQAAAAQSPNTTAATTSKDPKKPKNWKGITALNISPDGTLLATARNGDSKIKLYNPATGQKVATLKKLDSSTTISGLAFAESNKKLMSGSRDTTVRARDTTTGEQNQLLQGAAQPIRAIAVSLDGQFVASAGEETRIILWNAVSSQFSRILSGAHTDFVNSIAFSADGKQLASGGADGRVVLWDPATGKPLKTLLGHAGEVNAVAFSNDGQWLASGGADSTARIWNVATGQ